MKRNAINRRNSGDAFINDLDDFFFLPATQSCLPKRGVLTV